MPKSEAALDPKAVKLEKMLDELADKSNFVLGMFRSAETIYGWLSDQDGIKSTMQETTDGKAMLFLLEEGAILARQVHELVYDIEEHLGAAGGRVGAEPVWPVWAEKAKPAGKARVRPRAATGAPA